MSLTKVSFSMIQGAFVSVLDYGADTSGALDSTTAIQNAINNSGTNGIYFPNGTYRITNTINFNSFFQKTVEFNSSNFIWNGPNNVPAFLIEDCQSCIFNNCRIVSSPSQYMDVGIQLKNAIQQLVAPSKNIFNSIVIDGGSLNGLRFAVDISKFGAGGDNNNDFHQFNSCSFYNYTECGTSISATQAYGVEFNNCAFGSADNAPASYAIKKFGSGASILVKNSGTSNNTASDFYFQDVARPSLIQGFLSENSAAFFITAGTTSNATCVTFQDCMWEVSQASTIIGDGQIIKFQTQGSLVIDNCMFRCSEPSNFTLNASGSSAYNIKTAQIRSSIIESNNATPLAGMWSIDDTTQARNTANTELPILLNTAVYGTSQRNGVNGATVYLNGAKYLSFKTGSGNISNIQTQSGVAGVANEMIVLTFDTDLTVTSGSTIKLAGGANFVATQYDSLTLLFNGTQWVEVARSVNS
jgi:hypothetical protein